MRKRYSLLAGILALCMLLTACGLTPGTVKLGDLLETAGDPPGTTEFVMPEITMPVIPEVSIPEIWTDSRTHYHKPPMEKGEIAFGDMEYVRPDVDGFLALVQEVREKAAAGESAMKLIRVLDNIYAAYDSFWTMDTLANIRFCLDLSDAYYKDEYAYCADREAELDAALDELYYDLAATEQVGKLESLMFGKGFFDDYRGSREESVWAKGFAELLSKESQLENQYYETVNQVLDQFADTDFSETGYGEYYRAMEETAGPVMVELVKLRHEIAEMLYYEDYESFAYDWYYGRDFTPEDAAGEGRQVLAHLVPIYEALWSKDETYELLRLGTEPEDPVDYVASAVQAMGQEVSEPFDCMMRRDLLDMTAGGNKYTGSFEVYLTDFDVPFVMVNPTGTVSDVSTLAHEFGHFVNDYVTGGSYVSQDVSEIFSQAMEYLCLEYADDDTFQMDLVRRARMVDCLDTYVEQMAYHTFESELYRLPVEELTVDRINALYAQVAHRFGFEAVGYDPAEWTDVGHFFTEPFYVVSYVLSNDAAMQVYQMELEEPGAGVSLYNDMVQADEDYGFLDFLMSYGLADPMDENRIPQLAELFRDILVEQNEKT